MALASLGAALLRHPAIKAALVEGSNHPFPHRIASTTRHAVVTALQLLCLKLSEAPTIAQIKFACPNLNLSLSLTHVTYSSPAALHLRYLPLPR